MNDDVNNLLLRPVSFLSASGPAGEVAVSSRIRLARNLTGYPFPIAASAEQKSQICTIVTEAVKKSGALGSTRKIHLFNMAELSDSDRKILVERRLASREFVKNPEGTALAVCPGERCSIMINEEDQLRIQAIRPGTQLKAVWDEINTLDDRLAEKLDYAFDPHLGYLCSCPTNAGTGMRASVMLHLPALALSAQITPTVQGMNKLHLAVRGLYGEGSENQGFFYQISNQSTLGESEEKIIGHLDSVIEQIIFQERVARRKMFEKDRNFMLDYVGRAYGTLRHCYKLSAPEALNNLSAVRLGVCLGMFNSLDISTVNELLVAVEPGHLQKQANRELSENEELSYRAALCRDKLKSVL